MSRDVKETEKRTSLRSFLPPQQKEPSPGKDAPLYHHDALICLSFHTIERYTTHFGFFHEEAEACSDRGHSDRTYQTTQESRNTNCGHTDTSSKGRTKETSAKYDKNSSSSSKSK